MCRWCMCVLVLTVTKGGVLAVNCRLVWVTCCLCVCAFLCVRVRVCVRLSIHTSRSLHQFFEERAGSYVALGAWTALSGDQQWYETYAPSALPDEPHPRSFHKSVFVSLCLVLCPRSAHCESQVVDFRLVSVCVCVLVRLYVSMYVCMYGKFARMYA